MAITVEDLADFTTLEVAASAAGLARRHVNHLVLTGELPAIRIGQKWYVSRRDVNGLARQRAPYRAGLGSKNREGLRRTLAALAAHDGATTGDLAALTDAPHRTVLGRLQILEARGLVRRENRGRPRGPDQAFLTEEGWRFYREELS